MYGGINTSIGITNYVGRLTGIVFRHDTNNNFWGVSSIKGPRNNTVQGQGQGQKGGGGFFICRVNQVVVKGIK